MCFNHIFYTGIALCPFVAPVRPPLVQNDLPVSEGMPRLNDGIVDELEGLRGRIMYELRSYTLLEIL